MKMMMGGAVSACIYKHLWDIYLQDFYWDGPVYDSY